MRRDKKLICIGAAKATAFLLIFLILFQGAVNLFRTKDHFYSVNLIYDLPKNSVDVLLLGSSHMNCTISPMDLWNDYGITSFNAAIGDQSIPSSYFELRELLKVQKPKVVVLETWFIDKTTMMTVGAEARLHWFTNNIPMSSGVSEAIQTLIPEDQDKTEYYLNFYTFHNRWKELVEKDFNPTLEYSRTNRGANAQVYNRHTVIEYPAIVPQSETEMPPELPLEYVYKIIKLCRENGVALVFMVQPYNGSDTVQKMMNYVDAVAEDEGVQFVNFFYLLDEVGFDFATDMADWQHVNYFGAQKLTSYLGEYLQSNYQLEDHRGDPAIADLWNKDYEDYARELNNIMMKTAGNPDEYFHYLRNEDYILAWNAYSETPLSETALPELLINMGIDPTGIGRENYYCAVTKGDQIVYGKTIDTTSDDSCMVDDILFSFGSGITESKNRIGIHAGRKEYSVGDTGVNLVVYDPVTRNVVDSVNIDLGTGDMNRK